MGALGGWREYSAGCEEGEPGTYLQTLGTDPNDEDRVGGVMAFDSEKYFWETHAVGPYTTKNKKEFGECRLKVDLKYYKLVGGFLHKAERGAKL